MSNEVVGGGGGVARAAPAGNEHETVIRVKADPVLRSDGRDPFAARMPFATKRREAAARPAKADAPAADPFVARMPFARGRSAPTVAPAVASAKTADDPFVARMPFARRA